MVRIDEPLIGLLGMVKVETRNEKCDEVSMMMSRERRTSHSTREEEIGNFLFVTCDEASMDIIPAICRHQKEYTSIPFVITHTHTQEIAAS
jgi:hypothetical protein